jgi:zinc transport system substrate-binding protein
MRISWVIGVGLAVFSVIIGLVLWSVELFPNGRQPVVHDEKLVVVTSSYPLEYIAAEIGGETVAVTNITPAGSEPHDFEPSPREMLAISKADLFLYNGAGFEPWVMKWRAGGFEHPARILDMVTGLKSRGAKLIEESGGIDPHFWLDPMMMVTEAEIIRDAFIALDPTNAFLYTEHAVRLIATLTNLDTVFRDGGLSACEKHDIVVSHKAFMYLARAYGIGVTSIAGISPDEEPSPKELARIVDLVRAKGVKYIFFETTTSPKLSETLARETGGGVLVLNTVESLTLDELEHGEDYVSIMLSNLNNLRKALVCQ